MEVTINIDNNIKDQLMKRLEKARVTALKYLSGYDPNDLMSIMDAIDEDLECLDCWDDENDCPEFGYSHVDLLQQLDYKAGTFMFEDEKPYEIDVMVIYATFAFFKAIEGIGILKKYSDIARYSQAADYCIDAFDALQYGKDARVRADVEGKKVLKAEKFTERAKKGKQGSQANYEDYKETVLEELRGILSENQQVYSVKILERDQDNLSTTEETKEYMVRKRNNRIHITKCADYIYDKCVTSKVSYGKNPIIRITLNTVKETISEYLSSIDGNKKAHSIITEDMLCSSPADNDDETRKFPKKHSFPNGTVTP